MLVSPIEFYLSKLLAAKTFSYVLFYSCFNIPIESKSFFQNIYICLYCVPYYNHYILFYGFTIQRTFKLFCTATLTHEPVVWFTKLLKVIFTNLLSIQRLLASTPWMVSDQLFLGLLWVIIVYYHVFVRKCFIYCFRNGCNRYCYFCLYKLHLDMMRVEKSNML